MAETVTFPAFDRSMFVPLIEANVIKKLTGYGTVGTGDDWTRIDKSTVFDLAFNPNTETKSYIDNKNDINELTSYTPSMEQEIVIDGNNPLYALMYEFAMAFPVGSDAEIPTMLVMPSVRTKDVMDAFVWRKALVTLNNLNTVDKKISFTLNLNGDMERGTATVTDGKFTYVAATESAVSEASAFSARKTSAK